MSVLVGVQLTLECQCGLDVHGGFADWVLIDSEGEKNCAEENSIDVAKRPRDRSR